MRFFNDNRAVTIAIDTILIFGILTTFLTITYLSMDALNQASERAVMREEFSTIGQDLGRKFVNLNSEVSASFAYGNGVDFEYNVDIPPLIAGDPYDVTISDSQIIVESKGGQDVTVIVPLREDIPVYESTISSTGKNHVIAYDANSGLVWFKGTSTTPPVDNTPPRINITSPPPSINDEPLTYISNNTQISVNISDNIAIARVEYYTTYIDVLAGENERIILRDSVASYRNSNWTWETVQPCATTQLYPNGNYTLKAIVYDRAGNRAEMERNYIINNTNDKGPEIRYLSPTNSSTWCESSDVVIELDYCDTSPGVNISTGRLWLSAWIQDSSGDYEKDSNIIDMDPLVDNTTSGTLVEANLTAYASFTQTHMTYSIPYNSPILAHARNESVDEDKRNIRFKVTVTLNDTDRSNDTFYPDGKWLENYTSVTTTTEREGSNMSWYFIYNVTNDSVDPYTDISIPKDKAIENIGDQITFTYLALDEDCGLRSILLEARDIPGNNLLASHTFNYSGEKSTDIKTYALDADYEAGIAYNLSITAWDWGNNTNTTSHTVYTTCMSPGLVTRIITPIEGIWRTLSSSPDLMPIRVSVRYNCQSVNATSVIANITYSPSKMDTVILAYNQTSKIFIGSWSAVLKKQTYQLNVSAVYGTYKAYAIINGTQILPGTMTDFVDPLVDYNEIDHNTSFALGDSWITNGTGNDYNLAELRNFFVTNNATHMFFTVYLAGNSSIYNDTGTLTDIAIFIDTDQNNNTGFNNTTNDYFPVGMGADFAIFDVNGTAPSRNWSSFGIYNSSGSWFTKSAFVAEYRIVDSDPDDWVEIWLPLAALNVLAGDTIKLIAEGRDDFTIDQIPNPVPNNATGINYGANYTII